MNITLVGTKIVQDTKFLAFEKNNNVDVINITVDTNGEWTYKLDVRYPDKCCTGDAQYNIINLVKTDNIYTAILTSDMLPFSGKYTMQIRAINGDKIQHSDMFDAWVKYSIEPGETYNPVPSEFYQIEDNITEINNNPPKPGENGYWLIWDAATHQYKESDIPLPDGTLPDITADTSGKYLSNDGKKAYWAEGQAGTEGKINKIEVNGVEQPIVDKTVNIAVPTKTSDLSNDSGYITNEALDGYAKTADVPTKTSQLNNDSEYITASEAPVQSVNTKTGVVVLTQDDIGDGTTYVRTHNDFTNALKTQINTNKDNIAMVESNIDGLQTDVGTLQTNVNNVQTQLDSRQPTITVNGILKGDGAGGITAAEAGTDYATPSLGITGATAGQIAKITAVDAQGLPTKWEPVDLPSGGGGDSVEWFEVIDIETVENVTDLRISTDTNGREISGYNALAMVLSFVVPADSTQTSASGAIWVYPFVNASGSNYRSIINLTNWKTTKRSQSLLFSGTSRCIYISSTTNISIDEESLEFPFDGVRLFIHGDGDHLPLGTKIRCLVLSKGWKA